MMVKTTDRVEDDGHDLDARTLTADQADDREDADDQSDDEDESADDEEGDEAKGDSAAR